MAENQVKVRPTLTDLKKWKKEKASLFPYTTLFRSRTYPES